MNYKKQILLKIIITGLGLIASIVFLCNPGSGSICYGRYGENFPSVFLLLALLFPIFTAFYFLKEAVYLSWRKFAVWYLPIVAILILLAGGGGNGFNPGYGMDSESLTFFFSGLFAIISFILIVYKSIKLRGK
jgi:hypothetical protein